MGLFSKAYLDLYQNTGKQEFLDKSAHCLNWLTQIKSATESGIGWGYPFDWQSDKLIPRSTPNGIVTTAVGDAYWTWYKHTGKKEYIDSCVQICHFLETLRVDQISHTQLCFSYITYTSLASRGNVDTVQMLLSHGADPNLVDSNDYTALTLALNTYNRCFKVYFCPCDFDFDPSLLL